MHIDDQHITKLAGLAKLSFTEKEKASMVHDLNEVFSWFDQLDELKIDDNLDARPMAMLHEHTLREDFPINTLKQDQALALAPGGYIDYFKIPLLKQQKDEPLLT